MVHFYAGFSLTQNFLNKMLCVKSIYNNSPVSLLTGNMVEIHFRSEYKACY
jgi:hypothetical protein